MLVTLAYQELTHGVGFSSTPTAHTLDPDEDDRGSGRLSSQAASQALFSFRGSGRIDSDQDNARQTSPKAQPTTYGALDSAYQRLEAA
ncbi:MAG: hypothetical protein HC922_11610 [Leptolyngbyaceae cyanobacterium SM2_3_12]|nr:hypothetical protein [Leptolyngbyaceae cyanobacterium SM2_3_12]